MALEREFKYYLTHQDELVKKHSGKIIVIKGSELLGVYDSLAVAMQETVKQHALGTFLMQKCEPGAESYTQTFHSRVSAFAC